jgi:hypothetical protein
MPRGSKPGERRGGRKKGTPNKVTADIASTMARLKCDPIEAMIRCATKLESQQDWAAAGRIYSDLAEYIHPKRKAVELMGQGGNEIVVRVLRTEDE